MLFHGKADDGWRADVGVHIWGTKGLVTNYGEGGATKREGGPLRKWGGGKSLSHAEGGAQKVLG